MLANPKVKEAYLGG
ncbi:MAG: hypothetical protein J1E80_09275 [Desulfovibrionaceae bacterium]|nr:hypothetical protein [Desulfovibrionaceae bacterium]